MVLPARLIRTFNQKGFTLVELLVVIAVIAVLAAIVVAALNPLEQIRRGRDAKVKQDIGVIARALEASYTASATGGGEAVYPEETTPGLSALTTSQELSRLPQNPNTGADYIYNSAVSAGGAACDNDTGVWCRAAAVHGLLRSQRELTNARSSGVASCTAASTAAVWVYKTAEASPRYGCTTLDINNP